MAFADGSKSGGRLRGTPNRASREFRTFLDRVFTKALADPVMETRLVAGIVNGSISDKVFLKLAEYWAGSPVKQVAHTHQHSLASIIAGTATDTDDEDDFDPFVNDTPHTGGPSHRRSSGA
jgi:hypothetical protein